MAFGGGVSFNIKQTKKPSPSLVHKRQGAVMQTGKRNTWTGSNEKTYRNSNPPTAK
jgi:hypothetical protein